MSVDGSWNITLKTPMGAQSATLVLTTDGGTLSGQMQSPLGNIDLTDGTVDGGSLTWKAAMTSPMPMTLEFTATVDGDAIAGEAKLGAMGSAPFEGTRA
jgi:hypothetical protein